MSALPSFQFLHPFEVGERVALMVDNALDIVTVVEERWGHRYLIRFDSGSTLLVAGRLLTKLL